MRNTLHSPRRSTECCRTKLCFGKFFGWWSRCGSQKRNTPPELQRLLCAFVWLVGKWNISQFTAKTSSGPRCSRAGLFGRLLWRCSKGSCLSAASVFPDHCCGVYFCSEFLTLSEMISCLTCLRWVKVQVFKAVFDPVFADRVDQVSCKGVYCAKSCQARFFCKSCDTVCLLLCNSLSSNWYCLA